MFFQLFVDVLDFLDSGQLHSIFPEAVLPALSDIGDLLHGLDGVYVDVSVVHFGLVDLALELEDAVLD